MNITECFPMRKRKYTEKTPGRSYGDARAFLRSPVGRLRHTPQHPTSSSCNNSFSDQSLEIVWDNNSPSPARTLSLGKRKKHYSSDSSSSGGEISDLVQKLADKSGQTPDANRPLLALWMSRETNTTVQKVSGNGTMTENSTTKQKNKEFQTPSRRPRRVLRKCNKSKMKLLKQDIELLCNQLEKTEEDVEKENCNKISTSGDAINFFDGLDTDEEDVILSQVEFPCFTSSIAETQIMTNTQLLGSGEEAGQENIAQNTLLSKDQGTCTTVDTNDSIVTESWDFVDELGGSDDENMLEIALEDFEKSQQVTVPTVRRVSHLHVKPNGFHKETNACNTELLSTENPGTIAAVVRARDNSSAFQKNLVAGQKCPPKGNFSFVPRSTLQSVFTAGTTEHEKHPEIQNTNSVVSLNIAPRRLGRERQVFQNVNAQENVTKQQDVKQTMAQKGTVAAKPSRYSKEEIERKKLEAQNRRKQKMAQSQKNNQK